MRDVIAVMVARMVLLMGLSLSLECHVDADVVVGAFQFICEGGDVRSVPSVRTVFLFPGEDTGGGRGVLVVCMPKLVGERRAVHAYIHATPGTDEATGVGIVAGWASVMVGGGYTKEFRHDGEIMESGPGQSNHPPSAS